MTFSRIARYRAAATSCALLLSLLVPTAAVWADEQEPLPVTSTKPEVEPSASPSPSPEPEPSPATAPESLPSPDHGPGQEPVPGPGPAAEPERAPVLVPVEQSVTEQSASEMPAPAEPLVVPAPVQPVSPELPVAGLDEALPVTESAAPSPSPSPSTSPTVSPEAPTAAAAGALPQPVSKAIDSVVTTASGSPLHIQMLTVAVLLAAGYMYFRALGSKGRRSPIKPVE